MLLTFTMLVVLLVLGCSQGVPTSPDNSTPEVFSHSASESGHHQIWGIFTITMQDVYDTEGNLVDVELDIFPNRTANMHVPVTQWLEPPACGGPGCVKIIPDNLEIGDPYSEITATVQLTNPTVLTGYDVRGIIYPSFDEARLETLDGVAMHDGLTTLWNENGVEDANPYKAFNKETLFRPFGPMATYGTSYIFLKHNTYKLFNMTYIVEASWDPNPDEANAKEAVGCYIAPIDGPIHPNGSNVMILALLTDWQDDIPEGGVTLDLSEFGEPTPQPMVKFAEDLVNHTTTWQYLLTQGGGNPAGLRRIWLYVDDPVETVDYIYNFTVECTYDAEPPVWKIPGQEGIYDHISGPFYVWLFFYEAWDVSTPYQYVFWGNDVPSPFEGSSLKVVTSDNYEGYTAFGSAAAPDNEERVYGIELIDAQGWDTHDDDLYYACTRYSANARWSFIKDQPPGSDGILGAPAIGDVNGDGQDDIVVGARNHKVYVYNGNGTGTQDVTIWEYETGAEIQCTPALVDLNDDGKQDVVVASDDDNVYALSGATGLPLWTYDAGDGFLMHGSPAIGYLNGDDVPDVVIGTGIGKMLALNGAGPPGDPESIVLWDFEADGGIAGTPGLADVTGDGIVDVCFGSYDQKVHMLNGATGEEIWFYYVGPGMNNIDCSPVMVDINGDDVADCVIGARDGEGETKGAIFAINGVNGNDIWYYGDIWGNSRRGPAPAQIDGDGIWDFIVTAYQTEQFSIYAISGATGEMIYKRLGPDIDPDTPFNYSSPIIGDFTGDGHLNVIYGRMDGYIDMVNAGDLDYPGEFAGRNLHKMQVSSGTKQEIYGTPAMADIDNDGEWELIACNMRGYTYVLDMHAPIPVDISMRCWTQHSGNRWNTGAPEFEPPK